VLCVICICLKRVGTITWPLAAHSGTRGRIAIFVAGLSNIIFCVATLKSSGMSLSKYSMTSEGSSNRVQ
jgi:hypothetical protein